jgi:ComF family protein
MPLCEACIQDLPYTEFFGIQDNAVEKIFWGRVRIDTAGALLFFTKDSLVQNLIAQLKYHHNHKVGILFGQLMGQAFAAEARFNHIDLLIPIPIRKSKMHSRGYNQSQVIAKGIQAIWNKPIALNVLNKSNWTSTQTKKNRSSRLHALPDLFMLKNPIQIKGKNILLIDDVLTTGATLEAAVQCLMTGQPASISIAVAAYTL